MKSLSLRANAVSYLALAIALSTGTAYAAGTVADGSVTTAKLAKNAVNSRTIKNNAIKSVDVRDGALTGVDLQDGSLTGTDVQDGSLTSADLASGVLPHGVTISSATYGPNPVVAPDLPNSEAFDFTTPSGEAYLSLTLDVGMTCTAGSGVVGLYLDGAPVAKTGADAPVQANPRSITFATTVHTAPGKHTASIGLDCPAGNISGAIQFDIHWLVLSTS
jgi:hypothetical protein